MPTLETLPERIAAKITVDATGCWLWTGYKIRGYGQVHFDKRKHLAHRLMYQLVVGPIPAGYQVDHLCRTPSCVNPNHLEAVTQRTNIARSSHKMATAMASDRCIHGHPLVAANIRWGKGARANRRNCRECDRINCRARQAREKARALARRTDKLLEGVGA